MIKTVHRKFIVTLALYVSVALVLGGLLFWGYLATDGNDLVVTLSFVYFLILIIMSVFMNSKLTYLTNLSYTLKIRENSAGPLNVTKIDDLDKLYSHLKKEGYKKFVNDKHHYMFYRVTDDEVKRIFRNKMLEVVVYLNKDEKEFYIDQVDDNINKIKQDLLEEKTKVSRLFITQIKDVEEMDEYTKDQISENVFLRTKYHIISTINIGVYKKEVAVMLYSDTYSPSLHYDYHIEQIKKMI